MKYQDSNTAENQRKFENITNLGIAFLILLLVEVIVFIVFAKELYESQTEEIQTIISYSYIVLTVV